MRSRFPAIVLGLTLLAGSLASVLTVSVAKAPHVRSGAWAFTGIDVSKAYDFLWTKYRIITAAIKRSDYQGLRVTPNVYTTLEEVDTFAAALEDLLKSTPSTAA